MAFFPGLKSNFIAYRSSSHPNCIFEIHQQSGFSRVCSNCCWSCSFEPEILKIGQSSHKMYSNNILNFQKSTTISNACTKKKRLETYCMHHIFLHYRKKEEKISLQFETVSYLTKGYSWWKNVIFVFRTHNLRKKQNLFFLFLIIFLLYFIYFIFWGGIIFYSAYRLHKLDFEMIRLLIKLLVIFISRYISIISIFFFLTKDYQMKILWYVQNDRIILNRAYMISSKKYFFGHVMSENTVTKANRWIWRTDQKLMKTHPHPHTHTYTHTKDKKEIKPITQKVVFYHSFPLTFLLILAWFSCSIVSRFKQNKL